MREILVGRDEEDLKKFGTEAVGFLGRHYVKTGDQINLSGDVLLDLARPHVMLICGKRGYGKSYTLGVIAEEMSFLPEKYRKNIAVLIFDTMGIYWGMKFPNTRDQKALEEWGLEPKGLDVNVLVPFGFAEKYGRAGVPVDSPFSLRPSELTAEDWCMALGLDLFSPLGVLLERNLKSLEGEFTLHDLINAIGKDEGTDTPTRLALQNRLLAAADWGIFKEEGTPLTDLIKPGKINILDISVYNSAIGGWSVRSLVIGLLVKKIFQARLLARKAEEVQSITLSKDPLLTSSHYSHDVPMVWFLIDEAHEMLPAKGKTPATEPLLQVIREGRQPGLTLVAATQQPGKLHSDVLSQCDLVLSHRVTAVPDIEALNKIMANYMVQTLEKYLGTLPRVKGSAILLDDNGEKVYAIRTRPRLSWHGGESASMVPSQS